MGSRRVLELVERVCGHSHTRLVYITHHLEEVPPCISHVLHLTKGVAAYRGARAGYDPRAYT